MFTKQRIASDMKRNWSLYLMVLPVLAFYIIFCYKPMYGAIIAFKDFSPGKGIWGSRWVGLEHFRTFFCGRDFIRILTNTLRISIANIIFGFPAPIILALLINEVTSKKFAKSVQTVTYLPHFISLVVVCGMIKEFVSDTGFITEFLAHFGMEKQNMLNEPDFFTPIYVISGIWQEVGWGSIIYLAALAGVDQQLYEAAQIDGAGRFRQTISITIPSIMPTIITMFILRLGSLMSVGYEKIILLYNPLSSEKAEIISSYVYNVGLVKAQYGFSTAVGLFNSVINCVLVFAANAASRKLNDTSLW
ncbi:MAG: sugar ABC transporter permease [Clostridia bacterium]|nr:sugar ABC transporter permease [Clostridia bacterium]